MKCYVMFCVANLMKNMMTLFHVPQRRTDGHLGTPHPCNV